MEVNHLYLIKHMYARLVERATWNLHWRERNYNLRSFRDFLVEFLDELLKEDIPLSEKNENEYVGEVKFFDLKLDVIFYYVDENAVYIPTVFLKKHEKKFDSKLRWKYPVKITPLRPDIKTNYLSGKPGIPIPEGQFLSTLYYYANDNPKAELDWGSFRQIVRKRAKSKNRYYACQLT